MLLPVLSDAMAQASFRISGDESYIVDRKLLLLYNINTPAILSWFVSSGWLWLALAIIVSIQKRWKAVAKLWPLFIISILPYIWYEVLANHS